VDLTNIYRPLTAQSGIFWARGGAFGRGTVLQAERSGVRRGHWVFFY
jgi:hypothetical protein